MSFGTCLLHAVTVRAQKIAATVITLRMGPSRDAWTLHEKWNPSAPERANARPTPPHPRKRWPIERAAGKLVDAMRTVLGLVVLALFAACGSSNKSSFDNSSGGTSGGFGSSGTSGTLGPDGGNANQAGCSDAAKLVYVVSEENTLHSFQPNKSTFTTIGTLNCPSSSTPNSMAVDRSGTAWVNYADGGLFKVSTADASCQATTFQPGQHGFVKFGMAFATNGAGTTDETLFVCGITGLNAGQGLAKIDLQSMTLTPIGDFSGSLRGKGAELTGTGDGRLYGFFTTQPNATLAQIAEDTAASSGDKDLAGVNTGLAWAFSFWGGDFWFYTSDGFNPSKVTRLKAATDGSIGTAMGDVGGFRIVGAGVSTCAPVTPPPVQ
jgi:hypothetical protein